MPLAAILAIILAIGGPIAFVVFLALRLRSNGTLEWTGKPRLQPLVEGKVEPFIELRLDDVDPPLDDRPES